MLEKISRCPLRFLITFFITMVFVSIFTCKSVFVFSGPPASGDWVVTGTESYHDEVIVLNGNLIIAYGGNLTFRKVTLKMNCTYNGQYNITVNPGGKFYVLENSVITSTNSDKRIGFFFVWPDSTFRMNNSELHNCGSEDSEWASGLWIDSSDAVIENSLFSRNMYGIIVLSDGVVVRNNNITANDEKGIQFIGASPVIYDNYISLNRMGIGGEQGSPTIYNNTITLNNEIGIFTYAGSPTIYNNTIILNNVGIFLHNRCNATIRGNMIAENLGDGISCLQFCSSTIANNMITSNLGNSIHCVNHSDAMIQSNTITNNTQGIVCQENSNAAIYNNTITLNDEIGILAYESIPTIYNNTITLNTGTGIALHESSPTICNNTITSNSGHGINSGNDTNPIIQDNIIAFNNAAGIRGGFNCSPIIEGNNITSNNEAGIGLESHCAGIIQGNVLASNDPYGIHLGGNCSPLIQGNIITSNRGDGIRCEDNSLPEVHWNEIYGNEGHGIANDDPSVTVNATYNYWEAGPSTYGNVLYDPWLTPPEVTSPLSGETVSSTVTVSAKVDAQSGVHKLEFYIDDQLEYTDYDSPYEWNWDTTQYTETEHKITAKVYHMFELKIPTSITVYVDNTPPTVSIKEPKIGNIYSGTISVSVNATDNQEISNVHFRVDNTEWLIMTYDPADLLWKYDLNTTILSDGQHTLMVLALDKASNPATTSTTLLTDNAPPTLTIQNPQSGMTVSLTLIVDVQASDASGISRIDFYLQDMLVHTVTDTPYQWSWDTTKYPNGEYTITVKAYDAVGHTTESETTVTVKNVESPWWQTHLWTIIQALVAIGGLILGILTYLTKKKKKEHVK